MSDVKLVALWDGWCDPCATERPLALTEHGARGVRAWLGGVSSEDRGLRLTCRLCGQWQAVPRLEEDDPQVAVAAPAVPLILATALRPASSLDVTPVRAAAVASVPAPRRPEPIVLTVRQHQASALALIAEGLDVVGAGGR